MSDVRRQDSAWSISRFVLGTAGLGMAYGRNRTKGVMTEDKAFEVLDTAWAMGIRWFDTAEAYGEGVARLRRWLEQRGVLPKAHVVTKVQPNAGADLAKRLVEATERFRGAASVTLLSHGITDAVVWSEFLAAGGSGGVDLGLSVYTPEEVADATRLPCVSRVQVPGNIFDRRAIDARGDAAIAVDVRSIFLQGILLDAPGVAESRVPGAGLLSTVAREASRDHDAPLAALLTAAVMRLCRSSDRIVVGADNPQDLPAVAQALTVDADAVKAFVENVGSRMPNPLDPSILDPRRWKTSASPEPAGRPMKVVGVVQARTSSTRLPGKVLMPIGRHTMIERLIRQLAGSRTLNQLVVATSGDPSDDELAARVGALGTPVFRGELDDVLARFGAAAAQYDADVIVRLTGDCPLHTPDTVDEVVEAFLGAADIDYANNMYPYTRPDGLDVEVFSRRALEQALEETRAGPDREHVTPYLQRSSNIRRLHYLHRGGSNGAGLRWTVDLPGDLAIARRIWERLDETGPGPHNYEAVMDAARGVEVVKPTDISNRGFYRSLFATAPGTKAPPLVLTRSQALLERSLKIVPGGAQTYSKSWKQHIRGVSPVFLDHGRGARVWDVDGNEYIDLIQGLLPNILGYAQADVDRSAFERASKGHSFSLAHELEIDLAERLVRIIPCAEMVRFGKNGSDATAGAVRAARAFTGREHVAVCGYHGWQDWFIGTTSRSAGVPKAVRELAHTFPYNDLEALDSLLATHRDEFAAVIMEPFNFYEPGDGYLEGVKRIAHKHGAVLIFDEICTGFHLGLGGAQKLFSVTPDLATFGKGMGNGYPISCIVGRADIMRVFEDVFFSFTFAGDVAAMAAAMTVLDVLEHTDALARMEEAGSRLRGGTLALAEEAKLGDRFRIDGRPTWHLLRFLDPDGNDDATLRTLWMQEVTRRGVLVLQTHNISAALDFQAVEHVLRAYAAAFKYLGRLVEDGADLASFLDGPGPDACIQSPGLKKAATGSPCRVEFLQHTGPACRSPTRTIEGSNDQPGGVSLRQLGGRSTLAVASRPADALCSVWSTGDL